MKWYGKTTRKFDLSFTFLNESDWKDYGNEKTKDVTEVRAKSGKDARDNEKSFSISEKSN